MHTIEQKNDNNGNSLDNLSRVHTGSGAATQRNARWRRRAALCIVLRV